MRYTGPGYLEKNGETSLIGPDGGVWSEVAGWLEPNETYSLIDGGAILVVDECAGWSWPATLNNYIADRIVSSVRSRKMARRKHPSSRAIFRSSLWLDKDGNRLVLLSEESPRAERIIREDRGNYRLDMLEIGPD